MDKKKSQQRRAARTRCIIRQQGVHRLSVHRTPKHIYAQLTSATGDKVFASASTLDKEVKVDVGNVGSNVKAAAVVGKMLAKRAVAAGIKKVAFDRSGYKYHGRVKALADSAREGGLEF